MFFKHGFFKKLFDLTEFAINPIIPKSVEVSRDFFEGSMLTKLNYFVVNITLNMANAAPRMKASMMFFIFLQEEHLFFYDGIHFRPRENFSGKEFSS